MVYFEQEHEHHTTDEYCNILSTYIRQPLVLPSPTRVDLLSAVLRTAPDSADGIPLASALAQKWSTSSDRSPKRFSAPYSKAGPMSSSTPSSSPLPGYSAACRFLSPWQEHSTSGEVPSTSLPLCSEPSPQRFFNAPREFQQDYLPPFSTSSRPSSFSMPRFGPDLQMGALRMQNSSEFGIPSMSSVKSFAVEEALPQSLRRNRSCRTLDTGLPRKAEENIQPKIPDDLDKADVSNRALEAKLSLGNTRRDFDEIKHLSLAHQQVHLQHSRQAANKYNSSSLPAASFTSGSNLPNTAKPIPVSDPAPVQTTAPTSGTINRHIIPKHHPSSASISILSNRNLKTLVPHEKQVPQISQVPPAKKQVLPLWKSAQNMLEDALVIQHPQPHNYDIYVRGLPENTELADFVLKYPQLPFYIPDEAKEMTAPESFRHEAGMTTSPIPGRRKERTSLLSIPHHGSSTEAPLHRRSKRPRCLYCRGRGGSCEQDREDLNGPCKRCKRTRRDCTTTPTKAMLGTFLPWKLRLKSTLSREVNSGGLQFDHNSSLLNHCKSTDVPIASLRGSEASASIQCHQEPSTPATTIKIPTTTPCRSPVKHKASVDDFKFSTDPKSSGVGTMTRSKSKAARGGQTTTERTASTSTSSSISTLSSLSEFQNVSDEEDGGVSTASPDKPRRFVVGTTATTRSVSSASHSSSTLSSLSQFQDYSEWDGDDMFEPSRSKPETIDESTANSTSTSSNLSELQNLSDEEDGDFSEPNRTSLRRPVSLNKQTPVLSRKRKAEEQDLNSSPTKRVKLIAPAVRRRRNPPWPRKLALFKGTRTIAEPQLRQELWNIDAEKEKANIHLNSQKRSRPTQHTEDEYCDFVVPTWQRGSLTNIFQAGMKLPPMFGSYDATPFAVDNGPAQVVCPRLIDPRLMASSFRDTVSAEDLIHERLLRSSEDDEVEDAAQTLTDIRNDSAVAFHKEMIKAEEQGSRHVRTNSGVDVDDGMDSCKDKDVPEGFLVGEYDELEDWYPIDSHKPWLGRYRNLREWEVEDIDEPMDGDIYD